MTKCTSKYLGSPLYRGSELWDKLDKDVQEIPNVKQFTRLLVKRCRVYEDLLKRNANTN